MSEPSVVSAIAKDNLTVRAAPDTQSNVVGRLMPGATVAIVGRSRDGGWLQIAYPDEDSLGWISSRFAAIEGDPDGIPVIDVTIEAEREDLEEDEAPDKDGSAQRQPTASRKTAARVRARNAPPYAQTSIRDEDLESYRAELPKQSLDLDESGSEDDVAVGAEPAPAASVIQVGSAFALNDRPRGDDRLGFKDYADAFAAILRNPATVPPLTIGIYAAWGMGKSFLMQLIREALEKDKPADAPEFVFVDFNAWVYSGSDNLWAGLISRIYSGVEKYMGSELVRKFREGRNRTKQRQQLSLRVAVYLVPSIVLALLAAAGQISALWDELSTAMGISSILLFGVGLARELKNVYDFVSQKYTERAQQFERLAARPDFRDKIGFMTDIKREIDFVVELLEEQSRGKKIRLAIFIDDLDRCPPGKAVEVLEAIMLLLSEDRRDEDGGSSYSPFYVFLGLDARVLVKAIEERYGKVLVEAGISGYEYLDKIVQIPFTIPATNDDGLKNYLRALLPRPGEESPRALIRGMQQPADKPSTTGGDGASAAPPPTSAPRTEPPPQTESQPEPPALEEVSFTDDELATLEDFAPYLSHNPRRVKRIVNIYRLVRLLDRQSQSGLNAARSRQLIKWVILNEQWPYRMGLIVGQRQNAEQTGEGPGSNDAHSLADIYAGVADQLHGEAGKRLLYLDEDSEIFDNFIRRDPTSITAADIRALEPLTFNLNPAIGGEVRSMLAHAAHPPAVSAPTETADKTTTSTADGESDE